WAEPAVPDYQPHELVFYETELVGFTLRGSPFEILDRDRKIVQLMGGDPPSYRELLEGDQDLFMMPIVVKEVKEKADRKGRMMAWVKFAVETGEEFESPVFSNVWQHL